MYFIYRMKLHMQNQNILHNLPFRTSLFLSFTKRITTPSSDNKNPVHYSANINNITFTTLDRQQYQSTLCESTN